MLRIKSLIDFANLSSRNIKKLENIKTTKDNNGLLWIKQMDAGELLNIKGIRASTNKTSNSKLERHLSFNRGI